MWILPVDLSGLHVELSPGPHLLPSYYSDEDIDKLCWLLRATLKGVESELRLNDSTLEWVLKRKVTAAGSLVILRLQEQSRSVDDMIDALKGLGARCALLQFQTPQPTGYGWLEREVKAPLYRAVGAWLRQSTHALSIFNVQALPVLEAAGLTTDPVELIDLMERCVVHRTRYIDIGSEEADYRRSLLLVAGERLASRLQGLEGEELQAALEVILWEAHGPEARERFVAGANALVRVGLASYVAGDLRLGPLPRAIHERGLLGALEAKLKQDAWTAASRRKLAELRSSIGSTPVESPPAAIGATASTITIPLPLNEVSKAVSDAFPDEAAADEVITLIRDFTVMPPFVMPPNVELAARAVQSFRWLQSSATSSDTRQRDVSRLLSGLLRLVAARGPTAIEIQEEAIREVLAAQEAMSVAWGNELRLAVLFWNARARVHFPRSADDLRAANAIVEECLSTWTAYSQLSVGHLLLGEIATLREEHALAREHFEVALRLARDAADGSNEAAAKLALARSALAESRFAESVDWATEALEFYEGVNAARETATALVILGASVGHLGRHEEAIAFLHRASTIFRQTGDFVGAIECTVYMANSLLRAGQSKEAETLLRQAVQAADEAQLPISSAFALTSLAMVRLTAGAIDEAQELNDRACSMYESVGVRPKLAKATRGAFSAFLGADPQLRAFMGGLFRAASEFAFKKN